MQSGGVLGIKKEGLGTFLKGNILSEKLRTEWKLRLFL